MKKTNPQLKIEKLEQTVQELKQREILLRACVSVHADLCLIIDSDGYIRDSISNQGHLLPEKNISLKGKRLPNILPNMSEDVYLRELSLVVEGRQPHKFDYEHNNQRFVVQLTPLDESHDSSKLVIVTIAHISDQSLNLRQLVSEENGEKLLVSHHLAFELLESIGEAFYGLDSDWCFIYLNQKAEQLWGRSRDELIGKNIWEEFPQGVGTEAYRQMHRALEDQCAVSFETYSSFLDAWVEVEVYPTTSGLSVYFHDRTRRKKAEEDLRASEEKYRHIVETAQEGIWIIDTENRTTYVNPMLAEMLGYSVEEMLGASIFDFMDEDGKAITAKSIKTGGLKTKGLHEFSFKRKDDSVLHTLLSKTPLTDDTGNYAGALAMLIDVSDRKRVSDAQAQLAAIVNSSGDAIISMTLQGIITSWNAGAQEIYGYSAQEMIGQSIYLVIPQERWEEEEALLKRVAGGETILNHETLRIRKDGMEVFISVTVSHMRNMSGNIIGVSKIARDISANKQAELDLLASKEAIETYNRELNVISRIGQELTSSLDTRHIYRTIYTSVAHQILDASHLTIALFDENTEMISCGFAIVDGNEISPDEFPIMPLGEGPTSDAIRERKPRIIDLEEARQQLKHKGRSVHIGDERQPMVGLYAPMISGSRVIGVINIQSYDPGGFAKINMNLLEIIVSQCGAALANAQLYAQAQLEEERFRTTFEQAAVGIAHVAPDGSFARINRRFCDIVGYTADEMLTTTFQDITHPDDLETDLALVRQVLSGEIQNYSLVKRYIAKDGHLVWINLTVSLVRDKYGEPKYFIAVIEDITSLKSTEAALRQSEDRYRRLAENAQDLIYRYAFVPERGFEYVSPAATQLTGYTPEDHYADPDLGFKLVHPDDRIILQQVGTEVDFSKPIVLRWLRRDGTILWAEQHNVPIYDESGTLIALEGIARDITDRKRAEDTIRESEERYRTLFETMKQGVVYQDQSGAITAANPAAQAVLGLTLDQLQGVTSIDPRWHAIHEDGSDFPGETHPAMVALRTGQPVDNVIMGVYNPTRDAHRWILVNATPQFHSGEAVPYQVYATFDDITERRHMLHQLQERERTLSLSLHAAQAGVWSWDIEAKCIVWDKQMESIHGLEPGTFEGTYEAWRKTVHPEDMNSAEQAIQDALSDITPFNTEFRIVQPDGSIRYVLGQATVVRDDDGTPRKIIGINIDITDRKHAEEEIRRLNTDLERRVIERTRELALINQELEAFNYSVSHDLRTPLRALDGFSQAVLEDYGDTIEDEGKRYLERIRLASQRMSRLIDDLLNLSRVSRREMERADLNLSEIAREIASEFETNDPTRSVQFVIQEEIRVQGDKNLLQIVMQNLLGNAWKFTSKKELARIEFGEAQQNGQSVLFVRDNGAGFDMAYVDKLFGAFQRLHSVTEFEGTGIGLATVQRIIHRHGGKIWTESSVNEGATFYFTLLD